MSVMDHSCLDLSATPLLSYLLRSYKQLYLCFLPVDKIISLITVVMMCCSDTQSRDVTKISSFQVNTSTKSKWGIKLLRISKLVLFFFYFPMKVARVCIQNSRGKYYLDPSSQWQPCNPSCFESPTPLWIFQFTFTFSFKHLGF